MNDSVIQTWYQRTIASTQEGTDPTGSLSSEVSSSSIGEECVGRVGLLCQAVA